ncbi:MAG: sulfotransferase family protein [Acidimicrobiia bacterium]
MSDSSFPRFAGAPDEEETPGADTFPPTFIACNARSGSTLLRWLIDTHPQVACPGEADVALLINSYVYTATALAGSAPHDDLSALRRARVIADDLRGAYVAHAAKTRWCDKSLSNVLHLDLLASVWPDARFILLHRHCMDFVMSGIEASPWGLDGFGFPQFAAASPTNAVVALVAYWLDRTTRMLMFEKQWPERCLRVRYEDLVTKTDEVVDGIWGFIGVPQVAGAALAAFEQQHDRNGRADHKVWWTRSVHSDSIGNGARVPAGLVVGAVRRNMNELLGTLDYATVGDDWGSGASASPDEPDREHPTGDDDAALVELRVVEGHNVIGRGLIDLAAAAWVHVYVDDPRARRLPPQASRVVVAERVALAEICAGTQNVGAALRARAVRYYGPPILGYEDELEIFERLVGFLVAAVGLQRAPA